MGRKALMLVFILFLLCVPILHSDAVENSTTKSTDSTFLSAPTYNENISDMIEQVNTTNLHHYIKTLQNLGTRFIGTGGNDVAASWIKGLFDSFGLESRYQNFTVGTGGIMSHNVIGIQEGVNPDKRDSTIIISGHYDSIVKSVSKDEWAPGADDDASGIAAMLETARILSKYNFSRTIMYCAWDAEEVGLVGSRYFANTLDREEYEIDAMLQYDMIGYSFEGQKNVDIHANHDSKALLDFIVEIDELYENPLNVTPVYNSTLKASDHSIFWEHGYNATLTIEDPFNPYYHTGEDTLDKLSMEMVGSVTELALGSAAHMSDLTEPDPICFYLLDPEPRSFHPGGKTLDIRWFVKHENMSSDQMRVQLDYTYGSRKERIGTYQGVYEIGWDVPELNGNVTIQCSVLSPEDQTLFTDEHTFTVDSISPAIIDHVPSDLSGTVDRSIRNFTFEFSEPIKDGCFNRENFYFVPELAYYRVESVDKKTVKVMTFGLLDKNTSYSLKLRNITDPAGNPMEGNKIFSFTTDINEPPTADFIYYPEEPQTDQAVEFVSTSKDRDGKIIRYHWNFGEISDSQRYRDEIVFRKGGHYRIDLTVWDDDQARSTVSKTVYIEDPIQGKISIGSEEMGTHDMIEFNFEHEGTVDNVTWHFGDGSVGYGEEVVHGYAEEGRYNVTVEVTDEEGEVTNYSRNIDIESDPENYKQSVYWTILPILILIVLLVFLRKEQNR